MPRPTHVKSKVERAAIELFAEKGVDGVAIGEIAARAEVSQGALYRHYASKDALAQTLFTTAYSRIGEELARISASESGFAARVIAMVAHFCALYDADPALFRFLLLAQHGFLPLVVEHPSQPPAVIADIVAAAITAHEIAPLDPALGAAAIMGVVLQTATFHLYGRLAGPLAAQARPLAQAAIAAVKALGTR